MKCFLFPRIDDDQILPKLAIGVLIMFVPVVNVFAFGYLYQFLRSTYFSPRGSLQLPEWKNWRQLFIDGLRLLVFILPFLCFCWLVTAGLTLAFWFCTFGFLSFCDAWVTLFRLALVLLMPLFLLNLLQYQSCENFRSGFILKDILPLLKRFWAPLLVPSLLFLAIQLLLHDFYGAAWFLGFAVLFASTVSVLDQRSNGPQS